MVCGFVKFATFGTFVIVNLASALFGVTSALFGVTENTLANFTILAACLEPPFLGYA